mgnify:CR=1 FL=1
MANKRSVWVASAGMLEPAERMEVTAVMPAKFDSNELEVLHVYDSTTSVRASFSVVPYEFKPPAVLRPGNSLKLIDKDSGHLMPCSWQIIRGDLSVSKSKPAPEWHESSRWAACDGTLRAETPMRVVSLVSAECASNVRLQVLIDNRLLVVEEYYDVLHNKQLPGPIVIKPGQIIELIEVSLGSRTRVPCTWLVVEMVLGQAPPDRVREQLMNAELAALGYAGSSVIAAPTAPRDAVRLMLPKPVVQKKPRSTFAQRMQAIDLEAPVRKAKCGKCWACAAERAGCTCADGYSPHDPDGCFWCNSTIARPPCP